MDTNYFIFKEVDVDQLADKVAQKLWEKMQTNAANSSAIRQREEDELIGTSEACKILGCCTRTMQNYRDSRLFSVVKVGPHKAMYYRSEIEAFRSAHSIQAR